MIEVSDRPDAKIIAIASAEEAWRRLDGGGPLMDCDGLFPDAYRLRCARARNSMLCTHEAGERVFS